MAPARRYLLARPRFLTFDEWEQAEARWLAACPEAASYEEREVYEFLAAAHYLDFMGDRGLSRRLKRARIPFPPALTYDPYRLSRYLLSQWHNPGLRQTLHDEVILLDPEAISRIKRNRKLEDLVNLVTTHTPPVAFWMLRRYGMADRIPELMDALAPGQLTLNRVLLLFGRRLMHMCLTEPLPQARPSQWEKQKLLRRITLRDVQLRSMRRSLYHLRRERKALLTRLRQAGADLPPELGCLASELQQLRQERAAAEARHAQALAELSQRFEREVAQAQAELQATTRECAEALALLRPWGSPAGDPQENPHQSRVWRRRRAAW